MLRIYSYTLALTDFSIIIIKYKSTMNFECFSLVPKLLKTCNLDTEF